MNCLIKTLYRNTGVEARAGWKKTRNPSQSRKRRIPNPGSKLWRKENPTFNLGDWVPLPAPGGPSSTARIPCTGGLNKHVHCTLIYIYILYAMQLQTFIDSEGVISVSRRKYILGRLGGFLGMDLQEVLSGRR